MMLLAIREGVAPQDFLKAILPNVGMVGIKVWHEFWRDTNIKIEQGELER